MGVADSHIKYLMFGINLLVELAGLATLGIGVSWYLKVDVIVNLLGATNDLLSYIFMGIGGIAVIVGFFGCFGAIAETVWMLILFGMLMLLMMGGKIVCVALVYFNKDMWVKNFKKYEYSPELYQWLFTSLCAAFGALEVMAMVFAFYLASNIKRCTKKEIDEEKQDILETTENSG